VGAAVGEYLRESGMPTGWAWLAMLDRGDVLLFSGVAIPGRRFLAMPVRAGSGVRGSQGLGLISESRSP